ncbi:uncharacterized protein V6R79_024384 [Siganus canaliculatus]
MPGHLICFINAPSRPSAASSHSPLWFQAEPSEHSLTCSCTCSLTERFSSSSSSSAVQQPEREAAANTATLPLKTSAPLRIHLLSFAQVHLTFLARKLNRKRVCFGINTSRLKDPVEARRQSADLREERTPSVAVRLENITGRKDLIVNICFLFRPPPVLYCGAGRRPWASQQQQQHPATRLTVPLKLSEARVSI